MLKRFFPLFLLIFLLFTEKVYAFDIGQYKPMTQDLVWSYIPTRSFEYCVGGFQSYNFSFDNPYVVSNDLLVFPFSSGFNSSSSSSSSGLTNWWYRQIDSFFAYAMTNEEIGFIPCQVEDGNILCSAKGHTVTGISIRFEVVHNGLPNNISEQCVGNYLWIRFDQRVHTFNFINSNQQIIDNQNENTQAIIDSQQEINDSINNSDTTQANTSGSNWFSGFHIDNSKGFSSIITAPIRLIQGILNGSSSCSSLSLPVAFKYNSTTLSNEVSLPCGSLLWNNVPNAAILLYWSTIFGLFAWWVLRDMYKFIDSIRDPDNKSEFVMSL